MEVSFLNVKAKMSHAQKSEILDELLLHMHRILGAWIKQLDEASPSRQSSVVTNFAILALANDVTDLNNVLSRSIVLNKSPVDLGTLGEHAISIFEGDVRSNVSLSFVLDLGQQTTVPVCIDYSRSLQVTVHLIRNALRFTTAGAVILKIGLEEGKRIRFTVQDSGSGVASSKKTSILATLGRKESAVWEHLGLGLCARIIGLLEGRMGMSTAEGIGSIFWFTCLDFTSTSSLRVGPEPSSNLKS